MKLVFLFLIFGGGAFAQFSGGAAPWGQGPNRPPPYGKPGRPSPYSRPPHPHPPQGYGKPSAQGSNLPQNDDPIPANPGGIDTSYETQQLPAKLPILAPNGVVEIYNRVVDDLIKRLEVSFKKREIDPMNVLIRPTPSTPVRVPGHLQKRPFRRPGAPLYRSNLPSLPLTPVRMKKARSNPVEEIAEEKPSFRGVGKISKGPLGEEEGEKVETLVSDADPTPVPVIVIPSSEATTATVETSSTVPAAISAANQKSIEEPSSEEPNLFRARTSDEYFPDDDDLDVEVDEKDTKSRTGAASEKEKKVKKDKETKKEESEEDDEDPKLDEGKKEKDVEGLLQKYQNKNVNESKGKTKYTAGGSKKKEEGNNSSSNGGSKKKQSVSQDTSKEEEVVEEEDDDEEVHDDGDDIGGVAGGYHPGGSGQIKPNAQLTGLSKIKRASDVAVSVDARSAVITARLLVGPLNVNINDSVEPMERNVRATIPELEAELILMERHGVVFLQRFTLDRAYGQDVEISIPKSKAGDSNKKKKGNLKSGMNNGGMDPNHPMNPVNHQRFQTKMAAHISMEVVKILRSNNLRVNMMRTAQSSMSKLKLPIKAQKSTKKKTKKSEKKD